MTLARIQQTLLVIYHAHKRSFLTFLMAGVGTTTIYIGLFSFLWYGLHSNHIAAVTAAFICSATFQFFSNRKITFKVTDGKLIFQILRYSTLLLTNYLISVLTLQLSIWLLATPLPGVIASVCINPITGYLLFRYWVFRPAVSL